MSTLKAEWTLPKEKLVSTTIQLRESQLEGLRKAAKETGRSQSELIRLAIDWAMKEMYI